MADKPNIYYFFPLASIGGTESVHADVMKALKDFPSTTYIRYRGNVWKGQAYAKSSEGLKEGEAMVPSFSQYSSVFFASKWLEAPRFGRWIRKAFIRRLAKKINSGNSIVIFWHRESIETILPFIHDDIPVIDIVHNNNNDLFPDPEYLNNDLVPRLTKRVLVSNGLMRWINPLYAEAGYEKYKKRILTIEHTVNVPSEPIAKNNSKLEVLFVGRDAVEKRLELIEQIATECLKEDLPVHFSIIGPDKKTDTENLSWIGPLTDRTAIEEFYTASDVLLLTSSSEGFPKVIAEAMAFGCIPIATKVGGIPEHITEEMNGILTDPADCVNESVQWLKELLKAPEKKDQLSQNAYLYAKEHFGFEDFQRKWQELINELS